MSLPGLALPSSTNSDLRSVNRGGFAITGVTKIAGTLGPCRVYLHDVADGLLIGYQRSGVNGAYSFVDLEAGAYYLVITDDRQDVKRAKVEHIALS